MKPWPKIALILLSATAWTALGALQTDREWLAGDSHIHSHWSADYDETKNPPEPILGVDGLYATPINAHRARIYGLSWMVTTDHGGPNHSKLNLTRAYAELKASREMVPEVLQFYGMELNMPAMDHHTLIIPNSEREASMLYDIESRFDSQEAWPADPSRREEAHARRALEYMKSLPLLPLMFANHPSRSATGVGVYGAERAARIARQQHRRAGRVSRHGGRAGPSGRSACTGRVAEARRCRNPAGIAVRYGRDGARTFGGFDQMTAIVGGLWDSMLGEGRRFWIVATSDSHAHYADESRPARTSGPASIRKRTCTRSEATAACSMDCAADAYSPWRATSSPSSTCRPAQAGASAGIGETLSVQNGAATAP